MVVVAIQWKTAPCTLFHPYRRNMKMLKNKVNEKMSKFSNEFRKTSFYMQTFQWDISRFISIYVRNISKENPGK